VIFQEATMR